MTREQRAKARAWVQAQLAASEEQGDGVTRDGVDGDVEPEPVG